jgi:hypothetical protein
MKQLLEEVPEAAQASAPAVAHAEGGVAALVKPLKAFG